MIISGRMVDVSMNIKSADAHRLAQELSGLTGESLTTAVTVAVRERLDRIREQEKGSLTDRLLAIGQDCASRLKGPFRSMNHGEFFYDEKGLPK